MTRSPSFIGTLLMGALFASTACSQVVEWANPTTGVGAGAWSNPGNWLPVGVPTNLSTAQINNGGEAVVDVAVDVTRIEVGKNGGNGILTSSIPGLTIATSSDFDTGEIGGGVATGPISVTSNGTTVITDALSILVGTGGAGDLDVGQSGATSGATADSTGVLTIERVSLVQTADDVDVGQTSGSATATAHGTFNAINVTTLDVGAFVNVGEAGDSAGTRDSTGIINFSFVDSLLVKDDLILGKAYSAGGMGTGGGTGTITDSDTLDIGEGLHVGHSVAKDGGVAQATGSLVVERANTLQVGTVFSVGQVSSELKLPLGTAISGQAFSVASSASLTDVGDISTGSGLFVGRAFTGDNATGTATGTLTIDTSSSVTIGADLDVGQTGSTGNPTLPGLSTSGTGNVTIRNVVGTVGVGGDIDVGTTGSAATTTTQGNGTLLVEDVGALDVAVDLDVGQVSGMGQSSGTGFATIRRVPSVTIGDDIDVGRTSGSPNAVNNGNGTLSVTDSAVAVGFADPILPGSLSIGSASSTLLDRAVAMGIATFERSSLQVASRISVGELSGGGNDVSNSATGVLHVIDGVVDVPQLDVALVLAGTAGTADGTVQLDSSLLTVTGPISLGSGSTMHFGLGSTTRANGAIISGQYGAINANSAVLDGSLEVSLLGGFMPAVGNQFDLLTTTGLLSGSLTPTSLPSLPSGLGWNLTQTSNLLRLEVITSTDNADFDSSGTVDAFDFLAWQRNRGLLSGATLSQGDADMDGDVDSSDLAIWELQYGAMPIVAMSNVRTVPEPGSGLALALLMATCWTFPPMRRSTRRVLSTDRRAAAS